MVLSFTNICRIKLFKKLDRFLKESFQKYYLFDSSAHSPSFEGELRLLKISIFFDTVYLCFKYLHLHPSKKGKEEVKDILYLQAVF